MLLAKLLFSLFCFLPATWAHEDHAMDDFNLEQTFELLKKVTELSAEEISTEGPAFPVIRIGGERVVLNSHFWNLVRGWVRIYHREVNRDCADCLNFNEDELMAEAKDLGRRGFFSAKVFSPLSHATEHITLETADIGARLGNVALVAKISSEVAETLLSKTVGGGGVHILCNVIDAVILFGTRHLQVASRIPLWGARLKAGTLRAGLKYWLVSRAIRRARKRVSFVTGPIEIDQEALKLVDREGPQPKRWWNAIKDGKRSRWVNWLKREVNSQYQNLDEVNAALFRDPGNSSLEKQKQRIENKILNLSRLNQKDFLGKRFKRFFYLKARRGSKQMKGSVPIESGLNKDVFWILSVQENILNRALVATSQDEASAIQSFKLRELKRDVSKDEVVEGLAEEAVGLAPSEEQKERFDLIKGLLTDVEFVFDPSQPASHRYLQTVVIENTLAQFVYQLMQWRIEALPEGDGSWTSRLWQASRLRWSSGQFARYVYEYTDFLRLAAVTPSEHFRQRYKYEAMETLLRLFEHLESLRRIYDEFPFSSDMLAKVSQANRKLRTFMPWRDKNQSYSWIPFRKIYPQCEEMWRSAE